MSDEEMHDGAAEIPTGKLSSLRITSLDGDDEEDDAPAAPTDDVFEEDDDDEDDEEDCQEPVSLGFFESPKHSWSLRRELFPSLAGGTPAWLDPDNLPTGTSCLCDFCGQPLQFLLQLYAPLSQKESTFHRTLFVFMCSAMGCLLRDQHEQWKRKPEKASRCVKVFRCQLPRSNPYYSSEPPKSNGSDRPSTPGAALCSWCGTWRGDKFCGRCRRARYCSDKHQTSHWRTGHKAECQQSDITSGAPESSSCIAERQKAASKYNWPQFEIVHEDECEVQNSECDGLHIPLNPVEPVDDGIQSLIDTFEVVGDEKSWGNFQVQISRHPEQVLRYYRSVNSRPLWPLLSGRPSKQDIPRCSYCNGPRACEFQILPQLLFYFGVDNSPESLDWATIAVFTCEASCDESTAYKEEFPWVQLSSQSAR